MKSGPLLIVVTVPLEEYGPHVLMAESGDFRNQESIKALAIVMKLRNAVRSPAQKRRILILRYNTLPGVSLQKKLISECDAVEVTEGKTVAYAGTMASTYFHQNCGGITAAASEAWRRLLNRT